VIGYPVGHSMSPAIHNAGFEHIGFDGVYLPLPIAPGYEPFKATVASWLDHGSLHFSGASVTIPHKESLIRFVQEAGGHVDSLAERIGAANTLTRQADGTLHAKNTDYDAALDSVCHGMGVGRADLRGARVAVIGAGGAARAIVAAFAWYGANVVVYNRTFEKAQDLAAQFSQVPGEGGQTGGKVVAAKMEKLCQSCCAVYINCTPLGMHPKVDATPLPEEEANWGPGTVVFDTIYNPPQTRLLREAHAAGCVTISGLEMFVRQACGQFEGWTQQPAPADVFEHVVRQRLGAVEE